MKFAAILAVAATILSGTAVAAVTRARVAVSSTAPATVVGTGFQSGERVAVTFVAREMYRKVVTANATGSFTVKFRAATIRRCESYFVRAKGNRGSLAIVKVMPECAPLGPTG